MATKKVFLTGASGYIGGDALAALIEAQPSWEFSILTRSKEQFEKIQKAHPQVNLVLGSLDDFETISNAAAAADVVVHTADSSDHQGAARAIAAGLRKGHSSSSPGYYIHISGTGILCWYDADNNRYGQPPLPDQIYDDLDGVDRLLTLPDTAFHRDVDKIVLEESAKDPSAVKVAIVCPPTIYGVGRGAINPKSRQVPMLIDSTIEEGLAPISGDGKTEWHGIHVQDLSDMIVKLAEHANLTEPDANDKEIWGPQGYFLCENEVFVWGEISKIVAKECYKQGLIKEEGTRQFTQEDAKKKGKFDWISWGQNSRGAARRGRKYLGWEPKKPSLEETIPEMVAAAAKAQK